MLVDVNFLMGYTVHTYKLSARMEPSPKTLNKLPEIKSTLWNWKLEFLKFCF